jgi:hypothetical protein
MFSDIKPELLQEKNSTVIDFEKAAQTAAEEFSFTVKPHKVTLKHIILKYQYIIKYYEFKISFCQNLLSPFGS